MLTRLQKANREKIMKKEKRVLRLEKLDCPGCHVSLQLCWIGYSVYGKVTEGQRRMYVVETEMDTSALDSSPDRDRH